MEFDKDSWWVRMDHFVELRTPITQISLGFVLDAVPISPATGELCRDSTLMVSRFFTISTKIYIKRH